MRLSFLPELSPQELLLEREMPGQKELYGFLYMMAAAQGKNGDDFVKEVRSVVDPEFLKKRQAKARGTQWLALAKPGDETNALVYGRKVRLKVLESVIKEADVSDVLVALGLDDADALRLMDQFDIQDKDYNLSAMRQALRRAGGDARNAVQFAKEAETGKPPTPVQPQQEVPSATQKLGRLLGRRGRGRMHPTRPISRTPAAPQPEPTPEPEPQPAAAAAAPPMGSSQFYEKPQPQVWSRRREV